MKNKLLYQTNEKIISNEKIQYFFESSGKEKIIKVIEYSLIDFIGGTAVYNLGFGDFDQKNNNFHDDVNSNNGDLYKVFNTVLNTVPLFFQKFPEVVIMVSGSDSHEAFQKTCHPTCKKNCADVCKNADRRIKIYRYFVDKNYHELSLGYQFFGLNSLTDNTFVQYLPNINYDKILVYKRKLS